MKRPTLASRGAPQKALSEKEFIALFATIMSLTALSMDAVLPAFRDMANALALTDVTQIQWVVSALIAGMVFGELVFGPVSDVIGRKKSILTGVAIYILGSLIAMTAHTLEVLLLGRFIQGLGVAAPKTVSRALVRDLYQGRAMARIMSYIMVVFILVPMLAPAFGQMVLLVGDWRWIFAALMLQGLIASVWLITRQPETLAPENRHRFELKRLVREARYIVSHREVMCYTGMSGLTFAGLMLYLGMSQSIFQDLYDTGDAFPLYFAIMAGGAGLASFTNGQLVMRLGMRRLVWVALSLKLTAANSMLLAAWLLGGVPPLWLFLCLGVPIFFSMGLLFGNMSAMAMEPLGKMAGIASSVTSSLTSLTAVVLSVIIGAFYNFTVVPLAAGYVIFTGLAFVLMLTANRMHKASNHVTQETTPSQ
ncbi:Bicyclomycin resistance protein [Marinomonas aquimarina]|uniref:Bicyclomycin resistance protein n=1 Tax=Marinomonas aquimarina TaxID=295068 RepID=A0A1A8TC67_9GAMM|nr:multidrug effflux MFS transporter [Marinomonas aquimarina]SBS29807.1 Bicyclomycin resistance protein [Marinomonas aquimarina]